MTVKDYTIAHGNIIPTVTWFDSAVANVLFGVNYGRLELAINEDDVADYVNAFNAMHKERYDKFINLANLPFGVDKTTTESERTLNRTGSDKTAHSGSDTTSVDYGRTATTARTGKDSTSTTTTDTSTVTTNYANLANLHKSRGFNADELTPDTEDTQSGSVTATNGGGTTNTTEYNAGITDTNTSGGNDTSTQTRNTTDTLTHDTQDAERTKTTVTRDLSAEEHFDKQKEQMRMVIMQTYIHELAAALLVYVW